MPTTQQLLTGLENISLEITPSCNLACSHCYSQSSPFRKSPDIVDWFRVIESAHDLGCKRIQFIGGEPTYDLRLEDYLRHAHKIGFNDIEVYTNLTMLNERLLKNFKNLGVKIATSFYHFDEMKHDEITNSKGSFKRTIYGIHEITNAKIPLRVGLVSFNSDKNDLELTKLFLEGLGVSRLNINIDHVRPVGRGSEMTPLTKLEDALCGSCWRGKLTISWDGLVYPCGFSRSVILGNITQTDLFDIVSSEKLMNFRMQVYQESLNKEKCCNYGYCNPDTIPCNPDKRCNPDDSSNPPSGCGPAQCNPPF